MKKVLFKSIKTSLALGLVLTSLIGCNTSKTSSTPWLPNADEQVKLSKFSYTNALATEVYRPRNPIESDLKSETLIIRSSDEFSSYLGTWTVDGAKQEAQRYDDTYFANHDLFIFIQNSVDSTKKLVVRNYELSTTSIKINLEIPYTEVVTADINYFANFIQIPSKNLDISYECKNIQIIR
jgi:hypothetical protein